MAQKIEVNRDGFESRGNTSISLCGQYVQGINSENDLWSNIIQSKTGRNREYIPLEELFVLFPDKQIIYDILQKIRHSEFPWHEQNNRPVFIKTEIEGMLELEQAREQINQVTNSETKNRRA